MKKIAFVATAYIKNYDGISVYTENLLLEFLKQIQDEDISVDIYTGSSVIELLKNRISKENLLNEKISIKSVNDSKFISKILDLNFQLIKNAKYDLIFMSNFMPTVFLASKTLKVIHDFSVNNFSELYSKGYLKYHNMLLSYAKYFDHAIGYISKQDLSLYFNLIYPETPFEDNKLLLKLLKTRDDFFKQNVNSNKTYNSKKRYLIS